MLSRRRILKAIIASTLLGAATTVTVAWGVALRGIELPELRQAAPAAMMTEELTDAWVFYPSASVFGCTIQQSFRQPVREHTLTTVVLNTWQAFSKGPLQRIFVVPDSRHLPRGLCNSRIEFHFGWPLRSMWAASDFWSARLNPKDFGMTNAVVFRPSGQSFRIPFQRDAGLACDITLPTGVLPFGFTMNVLLFAAAWLAVFLGLAMTRRLYRRWRVLCPHCAYDLSATPLDRPCPECGRSAGERRPRGPRIEKATTPN